MAVRRIPQVAVAQPSGPADIDWSTDAASGLVFDAEFWPGNFGRDLAGGVVPANTVGMPTAVGSINGQGADFASAVLGYGDIELITGSKMTIEVLVQPDTTAQTAAIVQKRSSFSSGNSWALWIDTGSGSLWLEIGNSTGTATSVKYGISLSNLTTTAQHIIATLDGQAAATQKIQFYRNGLPVSLSGSPDDTAISSIFNSTSPVEIGRINNATLYFDGKVYFCRIYNTWFSEARAKRHAENYWALYRYDFSVPIAVAGGGTTISAGPGTASATGVTASISNPVSISAGPGNASAVGVSALVSRTIQCGPGASSATGVSALVSISVIAGPGVASATGVSASVSTSSGTTISAGPGNASAAGVQALLNITVKSGPGDAAAAGVTASVGVAQIITAAVGAASALGVPILINRSIKAGPGAASATGVTFTLVGYTPPTRKKGLRKTRYVPRRVVGGDARLTESLNGELERINDGLESPFTHGLYEILHTEPERKLQTAITFAFADGTDWNPGSGRGWYYYDPDLGTWNPW